MDSAQNDTNLKLGRCEEGVAQIECYKLRVDLYKFRAEEYRGRYESMRNLEWKVLFQVYAGFAAIAVAFTYVREHELGHDKVVSLLAMVVTLIFYAAARYLSFRIQERLIRFNQTLENYLAELDSALQISRPNPGTDSLGHQYYWTYHIQLILSTLTLWGLLAFQAAKAGFDGLLMVEVMAAGLAVLLGAIGWFVRPKI
jgi:hypothetical protein